MVLAGFRCAGPVLSGLISRLGLWRPGLPGELDGDGFEFGDEVAQVAVGVEVGPESFGVFGGEGSGDGPAADLAGPGRVGAVQLRGVGVAVASDALAAGAAVGERAGQD